MIATHDKFDQLAGKLEGEFFYDDTMRSLYATDASAYRELPLAVALPKSIEDIKQLVKFAKTESTSLIPRTAGTSLAGQVVGKGIVVDVSKYFTQILEVNQEEHWVRVQPGVVRDELNQYVARNGLFFGPETSTSNRCMIGGMVGNNSCGSRSIIYGSTREHLISVKAILSDGSEVEFKALSNEAFEAKCEDNGSLESALYRNIYQVLSDGENQEEIKKQYPKETVLRRNTGYAIDLLLNAAPFRDDGDDFNFCQLIAGSEGTLAFITEIKLNLVPVLPPEIGLSCLHFNSVDESLQANLIALKYKPSACELMDEYILECTKNNIEQRQNRFFVKGDPKAILVVEFARETREEILRITEAMHAELHEVGLGYYYPVVFGEDSNKVWTLRKAGLGLLSNMPGDAKPAPVIEDTAVDPQDLPAYIKEFNHTLKKYDLYCVHYAHASAGELHLRPILNLKTVEGNQLFRKIAEEIAALVKRYRGSLSGEHGDGRLRGEFIAYMIGEKNYQLLKKIKQAWDPDHIFNPGKIVDTPPMDTSLRFVPGEQSPEFETVYDFKNEQGILRAAEQCNGSGDCRKSHLIGGTMCPSYMATKNEKDTTRGRANILRETLKNSTKVNRFDSKAIMDVMDLCISCKGCKAECPSNVDVAKLKAEFLNQYYETNKVPFRTKLIAHMVKANELASNVPSLYNFSVKNKLFGGLFKKMAGFAEQRSLPALHDTTLRKWYKRNKVNNFGVPAADRLIGKVYLFCDEFTNYNDTNIGILALKLLTSLGYEVIIPEHVESGRTFISKGLLKEAKKIAEKNVVALKNLITPDTPLIGIEPSAILTFRDEYLDLLRGEAKSDAARIAEQSFMIEEFLAKEIDKGNITKDQFTKEHKLIKLHGHCYQKALSSLVFPKKMLSLPENYQVHMIPSGCCGMAGSFGYEKEHYDISMQIGELVLFPTVRKQAEEVIIAASGTSCRHQIKDGTGRKALHAVEIFWDALIDSPKS